jgi:hypothetical protein
LSQPKANFNTHEAPLFKVRFALSSATVFSRTDEEMDSEAFYNSLLEFLEDPEEQEEAEALLDWWNM